MYILKNPRPVSIILGVFCVVLWLQFCTLRVSHSIWSHVEPIRYRPTHEPETVQIFPIRGLAQDTYRTSASCNWKILTCSWIRVRAIPRAFLDASWKLRGGIGYSRSAEMRCFARGGWRSFTAMRRVGDKLTLAHAPRIYPAHPYTTTPPSKGERGILVRYWAGKGFDSGHQRFGLWHSWCLNQMNCTKFRRCNTLHTLIHGGSVIW